MQYINHLRIVAIGVKLGLYQKYYDKELKSREMKDEGYKVKDEGCFAFRRTDNQTDRHVQM